MLFQLFTDALGKGGAGASGRKGDLKLATPNNSRIREVAALRIIDHIAEHAAARGFAEDRVIGLGGRSGDHSQEYPSEVRRTKVARLPQHAAACCQLPNPLAGLSRHHPDLRASAPRAFP